MSNIFFANNIKSDSPLSIGIHASADSSNQSTLVSNESNMLATPPNQDIRHISNFVEETSKSHIVPSPALASQKPLEVENCKNAQSNNKAQTVYVTDHFKSCNSSQNLPFVGQPSDNHISPLVGPVSSSPIEVMSAILFLDNLLQEISMILHLLLSIRSILYRENLFPISLTPNCNRNRNCNCNHNHNFNFNHSHSRKLSSHNTHAIQKTMLTMGLLL